MRARTAALTATGCCALLAGSPAAAATERPTHYISTVVGNGEGVHAADDGIDYPDGTHARRAPIGTVGSVAVASDGTLYYLDDGRVRAVDPKTQKIRTVAGDRSRWEGATNLAIGPDGTLYVADAGNNRIRAVDPRTRKVRTVAGSGPTGDLDENYAGDGGPATHARLNHPTDVAVAKDGTLYIADMSNYVVRAVDPEGTIDTVVGDPADDGYGLRGDVSADALAVGADGNVYIAESHYQRVRVYDPRKDETRVAFDSFRLGLYLDDVTGAGLTAGRDGTLYLGAAGRILALDPKKRTVRPFAGNGGNERDAPLGDGGPAREASLLTGSSFAADPDLAAADDGTLYTTDPGHGRIRAITDERPRIRHVAAKVDAHGIDTFAGRGELTDDEEIDADDSDRDYRLGDLPLVHASGVAVADDGTVYIADEQTGLIRAVDPDSDRARVVAGRTKPSVPYDDTPAESGKATDIDIAPTSMALGPGHVLYVVDTKDVEANRVRAIDVKKNRLRTVYSTEGYDDIDDVAVGPDGTPYVTTEDKVCSLGPDGACVTVEESGTFPAIEIGDDGTVYYSNGFQIRTVDLKTGRNEPVAGNGFSHGVEGDGGPALDASLGTVAGMTFGDDGILYLTDTTNDRIRAYDPRTRALDTVAGTDRTELDSPDDVAVGPRGEVYIADTGNGRIRVVGDAQLDGRSAPSPGLLLLTNLLAFAIAVVVAIRFRPPCEDRRRLGVSRR